MGEREFLWKRASDSCSQILGSPFLNSITFPSFGKAVPDFREHMYVYLSSLSLKSGDWCAHCVKAESFLILIDPDFERYIYSNLLFGLSNIFCRQCCLRTLLGKYISLKFGVFVRNINMKRERGDFVLVRESRIYLIALILCHIR